MKFGEYILSNMILNIGCGAYLKFALGSSRGQAGRVFHLANTSICGPADKVSSAFSVQRIADEETTATRRSP